LTGHGPGKRTEVLDGFSITRQAASVQSLRKKNLLFGEDILEQQKVKKEGEKKFSQSSAWKKGKKPSLVDGSRK